ncbi:hypothetical protein [Winogradskyella sp.]|uniref:hypothetical protein n=1 Tax=Winogradskyella sp. TaxID=1883156 RepID=UPI0025CE5380|nr:hypothetical protein [Winogradskyella sp.]MBT8245670.1 hypothetical protein [Winogradskyella sp.]
MKRDIRELLKDEVENTKHNLPKSHRNEFLERLKSKESTMSNQSNKSNNLTWFKIAAVLVITLTVGYFIINRQGVEETSPLLAQIEAVETEYLENIHAEWISFTHLTDDANLVKRYEKRLTDLDNDYQEISESFKKDLNNILVVESLIINLQTRLQLLKDIQEHIKILNQKPRTL